MQCNFADMFVDILLGIIFWQGFQILQKTPDFKETQHHIFINQIKFNKVEFYNI